MHRCQTCPHWSQRQDDWQTWASKKPEWGICSLGDGQGGQPERPETLVFAADASLYLAQMLTHRAFGCILHPLNMKSPPCSPPEPSGKPSSD